MFDIHLFWQTIKRIRHSYFLKKVAFPVYENATDYMQKFKWFSCHLFMTALYRNPTLELFPLNRILISNMESTAEKGISMSLHSAVSFVATNLSPIQN